jgi:hypothetical protein
MTTFILRYLPLPAEPVALVAPGPFDVVISLRGGSRKPDGVKPFDDYFFTFLARYSQICKSLQKIEKAAFVRQLIDEIQKSPLLLLPGAAVCDIVTSLAFIQTTNVLHRRIYTLLNQRVTPSPSNEHNSNNTLQNGDAKVEKKREHEDIGLAQVKSLYTRCVLCSMTSADQRGR